MRAGLVGVTLVGLGWLGVAGALIRDGASPHVRLALGLIALLTMGTHLLGGVMVGNRPGRRALEAGTGWVAVQVERYRRLGTWFAAWGLGVSALAGLAAWSPIPPEGLLRLTAGINLGFQPGLLLAERWSIMARGRLIQSSRSPIRST